MTARTVLFTSTLVHLGPITGPETYQEPGEYLLSDTGMRTVHPGEERCVKISFLGISLPKLKILTFRGCFFFFFYLNLSTYFGLSGDTENLICMLTFYAFENLLY